MAQIITIIGGINTDPDRLELLRDLATRTESADVKWEWLQGTQRDGYRPPQSLLGKLLFSPLATGETRVVVLLRRLDKNTRNRLKDNFPNAVLPDPDFQSSEELVEWLLSADANLVPRTEWEVCVESAAFFSILAKLLKNKSWDKDMHGHKWTQEADLLGQSPVNVPDRPEVRREAEELLIRMDGILLLTKGGNSGTTKKEWAINTNHLSSVKRAYLDRSLKPLEIVKGAEPLLNYLRSGDGKLYRLDTVIQDERVRQTCQSQAR
jgi:hypothetical protein